MAGGHAKWPQLGREGVRKKGGGGCGTQTASLNQQHFLNIFNVKANSKNKRKKRKKRGDGSKFGATSESDVFVFLLWLLIEAKY